MYNTFGLYFHGSWSDPRSFSSDLVLAGNASARPGQHWGCSVDLSFQIPEMRGAAVLNSVNLSGESVFLLFMHCCFMNHVLLRDSTVVPFPPVPPILVSLLEHVLLSLTFSILLCLLCLLLSSFTLAMKWYDSRQELFTCVWRQFDKP